MTVNGPISPDELGFTLMHEHLLTRFWHATHRFDLAGMPEDERYIVEELTALAATECRTLVDVTPVGINRDPAALRDLSRRTGIQVVMGCGWYRDSYYPATAEIDRRSVDSLADELITEIETGAQGSGVRPGIIGEIGTEKSWMSPTEERVHRAAARAAKRTGLAIMMHSFASEIGLWQLQVLSEEGVDPSRVIIGHADSYRVRSYHQALLDAGANIEFDTLMWYRPTLFEDALDLVCEYVQGGFREQVLVSMDTCKSEHLSRFGGAGLTGIQEKVIPGLRARGLSEADLAAIFVENPRRILTVTAKAVA
ncbi:phosphotriesterase-related protein [Micromonospora rhizosphaerae]|uniref:Phosphotriesterase-related protein n=1 Tax=Micromonospora rhizosphaerae TaxID=568872 RepID=A0A1C6SC35_9ACTN|nr:phosphotriesterase [Micromonospora rhizosphaerae]SCL26902.1 phosphotriesterase-related protein [Micromonospora rhizosphaerae]